MILTIPVTTEDAPELKAELEPSTLKTNLAEMGYDQIHLTGLSALQCRLRDGNIWDSMPLFVEDDAEFLAQAWQDLILALQEPRPAKHWAYLGDGSFEISAILREDDVQLCVGEYQVTSERQKPSIVISEAEYICLWRSIAAGLFQAATNS